MRRALVDRCVDQLPQERLHIGSHELRRDGGDGEGISGEALDLEADRPQLVDVRFEHRALRRSAFEQKRRQKLLRNRLVTLDPSEIAVEQHPLVSGMLIYEP